MRSTLRILSLLGLIACSLASPAIAQRGTTPNTPAPREKCGTMEADIALRRAHPELGTLDDMERDIKRQIGAYQQARATQPNARLEDEVLQIPVVIHVIHGGQLTGQGINIPDAQVESQIKVLNQDFRRRANTRGYNTDARGADTRIEFVLAKRDPNGLATNGIHRVAGSSIGLSGSQFTQAQLDATIKPRTVWDANRYFNIWCAPITGLYGVAQFPNGSSLLGMACNGGAASTDGVTVTTTAFGSQDDGASFDLDPQALYGRTATHEVGHYLGLRHIWGDGNCASDYCEDTPVHQAANRGCPSHPRSNTCGTADEMFENYMDYSNDNCVNVFTRDQMIRMRAVLLASPRRNSLLNSEALIAPAGIDVSLTKAVSPQLDVCQASATAKLLVRNYGTQIITTLTAWAVVGQGAPVSAVYIGNLAPGAQDTVRIPGIVLAQGQNRIIYYTDAPNGQPDANPGQDTLPSVVTLTSGLPMPYVENFEGVNTPPSLWQINNVTADCKSWRMASVTGGPRGEASVSAMMGFYQYTPVSGQRDELYTPLINLAGDTSARLSFFVASAYTSGSSSALRVDVSTNCGQSWTATPVYQKSGSTLATAGVISGSDFIPRLATQWRKEEVNLRAFAGQTVRLRFTTTNQGGNNLYLDNISLTRTTPLPPSIVSFTPDSASYGDTILVQGANLGTTFGVKVGTANQELLAATDSTMQFRVANGTATSLIVIQALAGQATSGTALVILAPPTLISFSPGSGQVGDLVTIRGSGFGAASDLQFNGTTAPFDITSDGVISANVPAGATTGPIRVESRYGSATSVNDFIVGTVIVMTSTAQQTCSAAYLDPGASSNYADGLTRTQIIRALSGQQLRITFSSFSTESGYDFLKIYNGTSATSPLLGSYSGSTLPPVLTSSNAAGALTFVFTSDQSLNSTGWQAQLTCTPPPPPAITTVSPRQGPVGYNWGLIGEGLSGTDSVSFGGVVSTGYTMQGARLVGTVPAGATTSRIFVSAPAGQATAPVDFVVTEGLAYCQPTYAACANAYIKRVRIPRTTLSNSSACTDASGDAFTIFSSSDSATATLSSGGTYTMEVTTNAQENLGLWIDYNQSGAYEASEFTRVAASTRPGQVLRFSFSIPASALPGLTGMRIRSRSSGVAGGDACGTFANGEGEEYSVLIAPCPTVASPAVVADSICSGDTLRLQASAPGGVRWFASLASTIVLDTNQTLIVPNVTATNTYYAAAVDGACASARVPVLGRVKPAPATTITVQGLTLTAPAASQGPGYAYQWYLDGQAIQGATEITLLAGQPGRYTLQITGPTGCQALSAAVIITSTPGQLAARASLKAQPNPASGVVSLSASEPGPAELLDALGRRVWQGILSPQPRPVDVHHLGAGVYTLRFTSSQAALRLVIE